MEALVAALTVFVLAVFVGFEITMGIEKKQKPDTAGCLLL